MLAVLVRAGEVLGVAVVAALAAGVAGWWWLRRRARRLLAAWAGRLLGRAAGVRWAGLVPDRQVAVAGWRRRAVGAAWRLVRYGAPGPLLRARRGHGPGTGVLAGR
jgi:hypothetical protein